MSRPSHKEVADARAVLRAERVARKAERPVRIGKSQGFPERGRQKDPAYLSWLHDLECIGCRILGPAPASQAWIEAAHQKAQDAARGWHKLMGRKVSDRQCCPLCAHHHRLGPLCCDPAQAKFWAVLGVDVVAFCEALYATFKADGDGRAVITQFSRRPR